MQNCVLWLSLFWFILRDIYKYDIVAQLVSGKRGKKENNLAQKWT